METGEEDRLVFFFKYQVASWQLVNFANYLELPFGAEAFKFASNSARPQVLWKWALQLGRYLKKAVGEGVQGAPASQSMNEGVLGGRYRSYCRC